MAQWYNYSAFAFGAWVQFLCMPFLFYSKKDTSADFRNPVEVLHDSFKEAPWKSLWSTAIIKNSFTTPKSLLENKLYSISMTPSWVLGEFKDSSRSPWGVRGLLVDSTRIRGQV